MEYINFLKADEYTRCKMAIEIMSTAPMVQQMYDDICNALRCFKPLLIIKQFGILIKDPNGNRVALPGKYTAPGCIEVALIDLYVSAYDYGMALGIADIDTAYKAQAAHVLLHELSHSMQIISTVEPMLIPAMEWANEKNVWENLYPAVDPMLRKKYKIKIFEQTIDKSVGKVYSYPYKMCDDYTALIEAIASYIAFPDFNEINQLIKDLNTAKDITINLSYFGRPFNHVKIKDKGVPDYNKAKELRQALCNPVPVVNVKSSIGDLHGDSQTIVINLEISNTEHEVFFRYGTEDFVTDFHY